MDVVANGVAVGVGPPSLHIPTQQLNIPESSGEEHEAKAPKKRAETWVQEEIRALISFRSEIDGFFNTSKSNKHLWDQISMKMRERGFDRSPAMCTDKWRNLLKDYKKAKYHDRAGSAKMSCYKDLEELLRQRSKATPTYRNPGNIEPLMQYSPKGTCNKSTPNMEARLDQEEHSLALPSADTVVENGIQPWGWRDPITNSEDEHLPHEDKCIIVKYGDIMRKIGVEGAFEAIKDCIKSAFGLRTNRAFWLEDEYGTARCLDRKMPSGTYTLHLDEGLTIKLCVHDENGHLIDAAEEKTFYTQNDFHEFLRRRGWLGLRGVDSYQNIESLEELHPMHVYQRSLALHGEIL